MSIQRLLPAFCTLCMSSVVVLAGDGGCEDAAHCVYSHDDGVSENAIGLTGGGDMTWFNHFTVFGDCVEVTTVRVAFGPIAAAGTPAQVFVYDDPNDDGDPANAVLLSPATAIVSANEGSDVFNDYVLDSPVIVGSSFFVAVQMAHADEDFPAAIDQTASAVQSWLAFGYADLNDPLGTGGTVGTADSFGFAGNLLVRACADRPTYALSCDGDTNEDTLVNVTDLVNVLLCWGTDGHDCPEPGVNTDLNHDGTVDIQDLVSGESSVLLNWGPCPLVNDDRDDAVELPLEGTYPFHTFGATIDPQAPPYSCGDAVNDVWFVYTAPGDGRLNIDTCGSDFDTVIEVLTPRPCPPDEPLYCNDDCERDVSDHFACDGTLQSCVSVDVEFGDVILFRVGGNAGSAEGTGSVTVDYLFFSGGGGPDNPFCGDAIPIPIGESVFGRTINAVGDPTVAACTGQFECQTRGVWYSVVGDGTMLTASLCGPYNELASTLTVMCGPCDDLRCLGFDTDSCGGPEGRPGLSRRSTPGETYFLHVAGADGDGIGFEIDVSSDGVPCGPVTTCKEP